MNTDQGKFFIEEYHEDKLRDKSKVYGEVDETVIMKDRATDVLVVLVLSFLRIPL